MKILMFSTHSVKYIWYSHQKVSSIYFRLTGEFPCNGANDFEILHKTKNAEWSFSDTISNFSAEAKDFISKLLVKNPRYLDYLNALYSDFLSLKLLCCHDDNDNKHEGLDGRSGNHYSLKIQPIIHLINILGYSLK